MASDGWVAIDLHQLLRCHGVQPRGHDGPGHDLHAVTGGQLSLPGFASQGGADHAQLQAILELHEAVHLALEVGIPVLVVVRLRGVRVERLADVEERRELLVRHLDRLGRADRGRLVEGAEVRERTTDVDADPVMEARNLIAAATRRLLARHSAVSEPEQLLKMRTARLDLELIVRPDTADSAAEALLGWIKGASEELG